MSSLRNAAKRITHKERSQPFSRKKLGFLEKKKDYKLRATDYHKKEKIIKNLKQKAANRNEDEYYFKMANTKTKVNILFFFSIYSLEDKSTSISFHIF